MLMVTAATAGIGNSIFHPADYTLLNQRVSQRRLGHAFSVHGLAGNLGWAAGPLAMAGTASLVGWQLAGLVATMVGAAVLGILWLRRSLLDYRAGDHASATTPEQAGAPAGYLAFLSSGAVWTSFGF